MSESFSIGVESEIGRLRGVIVHEPYLGDTLCESELVTASATDSNRNPNTWLEGCMD